MTSRQAILIASEYNRPPLTRDGIGYGAKGLRILLAGSLVVAFTPLFAAHALVRHLKKSE